MRSYLAADAASMPQSGLAANSGWSWMGNTWTIIYAYERCWIKIQLLVQTGTRFLIKLPALLNCASGNPAHSGLV
jgi:hypothetical protein